MTTKPHWKGDQHTLILPYRYVDVTIINSSDQCLWYFSTSIKPIQNQNSQKVRPTCIDLTLPALMMSSQLVHGPLYKLCNDQIAG